MRVVDVSPPEGFPAQVIVLDRGLAERAPGRAFYLRVQQDGGKVLAVILEGEHTMVGAVANAVRRGYSPTHWMETEVGVASELPSSIALRHGTEGSM